MSTSPGAPDARGPEEGTDPRTVGAERDGKVHELSVEGLRAGVPGREVLSGVDLVVRSGEIHAVMGPNGSGKSTLAHVLMGKPGYQVLGGRVTLDGEDLLSLAPWERARLGLFLAPQDPTEVPGVRLDAMLTEALAARESGPTARTVARRAEAEASLLGLETRLLERSLNVDLSGGERKRSETLQLAVIRPHLAVLDELDSGLDVDALREVASRVRSWVGEWGLGVLAITHYRRLLAVLVPDRVHVLVDGRIVAEGGPELAEEVDMRGYSAY